MTGLEVFNSILEMQLKTPIVDKDYDLLVDLLSDHTPNITAQRCGEYYLRFGPGHILIEYHSRRILICRKR